MSNIIRIADLIDKNERKAVELTHYARDLERAKRRLIMAQHEVELIQDIIKLIEQEKIVDLANLGLDDE